MKMMNTRHGAKILFMSIAICRTGNTPTFRRYGMMLRKSLRKVNGFLVNIKETFIKHIFVGVLIANGVVMSKCLVCYVGRTSKTYY